MANLSKGVADLLMWVQIYGKVVDNFYLIFDKKKEEIC